MAATFTRQRRIYGASAAAVAVAVSTLVVTQRRLRRNRDTFENAPVVITGGSRGFGLALGRHLAGEHARIAILARDRDELARAASDLRQRGASDVLALACDVRNRDAVEQAIEEVLRSFGRVDLLVNNAGVMHVAPALNTVEEDFRASIDTHFWAPLYLTRACLPSMLASGGRIVNISSIGGLVPVPHLAAYCAGKFALTGLSETLRMELAQYGVSVTTVTPFVMRTGSHRTPTIRGQHRKEAAWFALGTASALTSIDADRAAAQVIEAARARRARVSPGWQSRAAELFHAVLPRSMAALGAAVNAFVMPAASTAAEAAEIRVSRELNLSPLSRLFPTRAAEAFNQTVASDEIIKPSRRPPAQPRPR